MTKRTGHCRLCDHPLRDGDDAFFCSSLCGYIYGCTMASAIDAARCCSRPHPYASSAEDSRYASAVAALRAVSQHGGLLRRHVLRAAAPACGSSPSLAGSAMPHSRRLSPQATARSSRALLSLPGREAHRPPAKSAGMRQCSRP